MIKAAHINGDTRDIQSIEEHSHGVAELAGRFAAEFGYGDFGTVLGELHDFGKESEAFQKYIYGHSGHTPEWARVPRVPHAYIGAVAAKILYSRVYPLLGYCIAGHHAGLYDYNELSNKIMTQQPPRDITFPESTIDLSLPTLEPDPNELHLLIRMLFSCLVDADYLDTERFMNPQQAEARNRKTTLKELLPRLESYLAELKSRAIESDVNNIREEVQATCRYSAEMNPGFFSLTVPTGGGKTLSSLLWAMRHAVKHDKKRIIIAIPFTSIIVQTAAILRNIFGAENVLEHHSMTDFDTTGKDGINKFHKLATENWDAPIVVTTNVQLFESLFANKPSKCRKLHNLCNSVLILDEVQALPLEHFQPILDSLKTLQRLFGVSVLFTTASQPFINHEEIVYDNAKNLKLKGIGNVYEIIDDSESLSKKLRRATIHIEGDVTDYDSIAARIAQHPRILCVVNTRKDAQEIYSRLPDDGQKYHLSRMMCPAHVRQTIGEIKRQLQSNAPVIRVISTQLIEAGVDIDFPVVFRQQAGLDSIIQAAGRCNREGKLTMGDTYVFKLNRGLPPGTLSRGADAMSALDKDSDWFAPATMAAYFKQLYYRTDTFDRSDMKSLLYEPRDLAFATAAQEFRLIDDNSTGVIVNFGNSLELVEELKRGGVSYSLMRKLGQYTVSVRERDFKSLQKNGMVDEVVNGVYVLNDPIQYDAQVGITLNNHWLDEILIK
jgi:CRISPR-associated endonuclease/helicase Cas3